MMIREELANLLGAGASVKELWELIEYDRAELLKDRYQIGEILEVETSPGKCIDAIVSVRDKFERLVFGKVRRKPRSLTHSELEFDVITHFGITTDEARALPESVLVAMLKKIGAPTTVEVKT